MSVLPCRAGMLLALMMLAGCAAPTPAAPATGPRDDTGSQPTTARIARTLVMASRSETPSVSSRPLRVFGLTSTTVSRLFNAGLSLRDNEGNSHPYLAEALPQLNAETWQVLPDARMETTYRLRANLVWHDGTPLTADDFVFGWQVYSTPELGASRSEPIAQMVELLSPDPRTVLIKWRRIYPDAASMDMRFQPLPAHILREPLQSALGGDAEAFVNLPFWTRDYVGAGAYRLNQWIPGSSIEASAFEGHALGGWEPGSLPAVPQKHDWAAIGRGPRQSLPQARPAL